MFYTFRAIIGLIAWLFFLAMTIYALTQRIWSVAFVGAIAVLWGWRRMSSKK